MGEMLQHGTEIMPGVWWPWRRVVLPRPRVQTNKAVAHISVIICFSFLSRSAMLELVLLR